MVGDIALKSRGLKSGWQDVQEGFADVHCSEVDRAPGDMREVVYPRISALATRDRGIELN